MIGLPNPGLITYEVDESPLAVCNARMEFTIVMNSQLFPVDRQRLNVLIGRLHPKKVSPLSTSKMTSRDHPNSFIFCLRKLPCRLSTAKPPRIHPYPSEISTNCRQHRRFMVLFYSYPQPFASLRICNHLYSPHAIVFHPTLEP
jgi:hypothetical protein